MNVLFLTSVIRLGLLMSCSTGIATFASFWLFALHRWDLTPAVAIGWLSFAIAGILSAAAVVYLAGAIIVILTRRTNLRPISNDQKPSLIAIKG